MPVVAAHASTATARATAQARSAVLQSITDAAREIFVERGYHGASIRDIAARAGVSLSALYYWHASKQDLLAALLLDSRRDYLQACHDELAAVPADDAAGRLAAVVGATIRYRIRRQVESALSAQEWRHLEQPHREELEQVRIAAGALWDQIIDDGVRRGVFTCDYPDDARRAVQAACNAVAQWYDPAGPVGADELAARYVDIALRIVQLAPPTRGRARA